MVTYQAGKLGSGPIAFGAAILLLQPAFGIKSATAIGLTIWMALWWIFRPVSISVTALLPIIVNAVFNLIPNEQVISRYFSEIVVLLLGADLICMTWSRSGLDKRLAVKTLCFIGTSMRGQIFVWLGAATVLSIFLPNVVVAAILCPIAVAMLKFVGEKDIAKSSLAVPILLAIGWGSGIGGLGSPIGSSANLVAISYIEAMTGQEFMYFEWMLRFLPMLVLLFLLNLGFLFWLSVTGRGLPGTREYFQQLYRQFGPMRRAEKIGLFLFVLAALLAFLRPLFAAFLPGLKPAYCFLLLGMVTFILRDEVGKPLLEWEYAERHAMWGMYLLFASGIALGQIIIQTQAAVNIASLLTLLPLHGHMETMFIFVAFAVFMTEVSSNTAAMSIAIPIVAGICQTLGLNPFPYILATIVAASCAYVLPVSTRAIPVAFGLKADVQIHQGLKLTCLNTLLTTVVCYVGMLLFPGFMQL